MGWPGGAGGEISGYLPPMPESTSDPVEFLGYTLRRDQANFLDLVINHGHGARFALMSMGRAMTSLSVWLKDPTFKQVWLETGKPMLAVHYAEDAQDILQRAVGEIMNLEGDDVKKASALSNVARSRADYKFKTAERLNPKEWGPKTQIEGTVEHRAIVFLPELATLPPAPVKAELGEGAPHYPQLPAHVTEADG